MSTASTEKRDVLLHFDEETNELVFYTVESDRVQAIRDREFAGARVGVASYLEKTADEAEKSLGSVVFSLINKFAIKKIGIRDYEARIDAAHQEYVEKLEKRALDNEPEALFKLSLERHRAAMSELSLAYLDEADELLRKSVEFGCEDARDFLASEWPILRDVTLERIARE